MFVTTNPADGSSREVIDAFDGVQLENVLVQAAHAAPHWRALPVAERCALMRRAAAVLRELGAKVYPIATRPDGMIPPSICRHSPSKT